ncbi:MAG: hypothetical protein KC535_02050, partial [Nanoarchaeota archaeon]|nr:hypothetical protein [Nanoarchaeota archaeon]
VDSLKNGMNSSNSSSLLSSMDEVLENTDGYSSYFSPKLISGLFGAISALTGGVFFSAARDDYKHKKRGFENEHSHHHKLLEEANDDYERIEDADSKRKIRHLINKKLDLIESTPRSFERLLCEYRDLCLSARSNTFDRTYDRIKNGDSYTGVKI